MPTGNSRNVRSKENYSELKEWILSKISPDKKTGIKTELRPILTAKYPLLLESVSKPRIKNGIQTFDLRKLFVAVGVPISKPCSECGTPTKFNGDFNVPREFCSPRCSSLNEDVQARLKKTNLEKRGVTNPSLDARVVKKRRKTCLKNSGYVHQMKDPRCLKKSQDSCLKTTGYRFALQNPEIFSRSRKAAFSTKEGRFRGRSLDCMGYEPVVLEALGKKGSIRQLTTKIGGLLPAVDYTNCRGGKSRYFPDIGVKLKSGKWLVIEVKSAYTLYGNTEREYSNRKKFSAARKLGRALGFEFWIALVRDRQITWIRDGKFTKGD